MSRPQRRQSRQPQPQTYAVVSQTSPGRQGSYSAQYPNQHPYQHQPPPQPQFEPQHQPQYSYQPHPQQYIQQQPQHISQVAGPRSPPPRSASAGSRRRNGNGSSARGNIAQGVATGVIGAGYGPYSYNPSEARDAGVYASSRFSNAPSELSVANSNPSYDPTPVSMPVPVSMPIPMPMSTPMPTPTPPPQQNTQTMPQYLWDKDPDLDDALHNPDPVKDSKRDSCTPFSLRGWVNALTLIIMVFGLLTLFAGYPVIFYFTARKPGLPGFNLGGINGSGQIPDLNIPSLIDSDTPSSAYTRIGHDGRRYNLAFSDEFETPGRSFYPGDDPYWEAVDLHYWPTGDLEWYDPSAITTQDGKLVITLTEKTSHDLNFESGMLTSWNKMCFNTGYVEVSVSMPGSVRAPGLWPGIWSLGNLGRAGYGATTEGMWPYSYDTCDLGTFPNQTARDGTPEIVSSSPEALSYLPGQKLSACSCPGSDHPGPRNNVGRGAPEIDVLETQIDTDRFVGQVSQSFQAAPYNWQYEFDDTEPATHIYTPDTTHFNSYKGGVFQQAISAVTDIKSENYNGSGYAAYGYEWWYDSRRRQDSFITFFSDGIPSWTATSATTGPDPISQVSSRIVPEEPMYLIMNLGMAPHFQRQDFKNLRFPARMYIDYVRVYQREDVRNGITCNPRERPTTDYIERHIQAYTNPNLTTWAQAGNTFPRNSLYDGC